MGMFLKQRNFCTNVWGQRNTYNAMKLYVRLAVYLKNALGAVSNVFGRSLCKVTVLWIQQAKTDKTILNSKANIIIRDNKKEHVC